MINRLRTYKNGVHGAFFLEVADFLGGYDLLNRSFAANADETIALRKRFEDLWQVKQDLERDITRHKAKIEQMKTRVFDAEENLSDALTKIEDLKNERGLNQEKLNAQEDEIFELKQKLAE